MPATDAYNQNIQYSLLSDVPNGQSLGQEIVTGIVPQIVLHFASSAARAAALVGTSAPVAGMVSWLNDQAVLQVYDGTAWTTVAASSSTWANVPLQSGYTNNGNNNGTFQYRVVNLFGEPTIMFRGGVSIAYTDSGGAIANGGIINSSALPTSARPSTLRTMAAPCSVGSSSSASVKLDCQTDGFLRIVGTNTSDVKPPWVAFNGLYASL